MRGLAGTPPANSGDVEIKFLFATPVITLHLHDADRLNSDLEPLILCRMERERSVQGSNVGGWHSDHALMKWGGKSAKQIASTVTNIVAGQTRNLLAPKAKAPKWSVSAWANVGGDGAYNMPHAHGRSFWSAIYYVRVDDGEGGELVMHDPRLPQTEMHAPHLRFRDAGGERLFQIEPATGLLVVMPSWLMHSVRPFRSDGLRISVAMNFSAPDK